jgi:hypothetical protein
MPGADACVSTQDLARQVESRLGRAVFVSASLADVSVEGHIEPSPDGLAHRGFRAVITLRDAKGALLGTRELARPEASCDGMREPLALVIAVMIDPDAALAPKPTQPPSAPAPLPEPPPPMVIEKPVYITVPTPAPKPVWHIDVGAAAATTLGLVPAPNLGVAASGLLDPPGLFPLEGFGAAWFDDTVHGGGSSASFILAYIGGGLCPLHHTSGRFRLYGCAVGEVGLFSRTVGALSPDTNPYLAGGVEGRVSVRLAGPFALRLGVSGVVPLFRPATGVASTDLFRPSVVGGTADLGVGVLLP